MRVEDLRYFEHLAEVLNYTRASKDLEISQPTLSLAIKRLEEEWGVQLFSRNRSTVELTDIGRDISDCVTGALRSLDRRVCLPKNLLALKTPRSISELSTPCRASSGHRRCSSFEKRAIRSAYHGYAGLFARTASQIAHRAA